ncbi:MAG: NAD-dependent epimerase/dehydratase family protein [Promethearchaeota archaeon]
MEIINSSQLKTKNYLVTGCAGFIGSHLCEYLLNIGANVVGLDNLSNGNTQNMDSFYNYSNFKFIKGDIRKKKDLSQINSDINTIFHEAAMISVLESVKNPSLCYNINVNGTLNLLEYARKYDVKKIIFASSAAVYGNDPKLPKVESMALSPTSPYGKSKLKAEELIQKYTYDYGLDSTILRYFNVYGPKQGNSPYSGVISIFVSRALKDQDLIIFGDGKQTRDYVYVKDVVKANILARLSENTKGMIFNIATGISTDLNTIAKIIINMLNKTYLKIIYKKEREGDIKHSSADISLAKKYLKFQPEYSIERGLRELIEFNLKHLKK